ncbi:DUF6646 family protein [Bergeyella zoohelcum]|uniref:Outer membrane protein beta-barrel domain-containing protein n=1 Tax=Bergeyella zoohelcum ATCC 43767 TaxID=883096 RepID=K1M3P0_9FLAO|nr:DUF6646 family protein [Bergeyella zoohelcum]EKB58857.1 hypothetical protein HMPREF9699_00488 [Bergeyella zoohelcum ATCC 43767]SUV49323.1 Uncharacterised protein [Bergeyella zoohelcum]
MKKLFTMAAISFGLAMGAQEVASDNSAFRGASDLRLNVGANIQHGGTGIAVILDKGFGESFSAGIQAGYLLGVDEAMITEGAKPHHRFDAKVRANANLGSVIGFPEELDVYPGLNLGLKNFGGHVGTRYFFSKGFGVFAEAQFPLARFNKRAESYQLWNNQFAFLIGASFDLTKR